MIICAGFNISIYSTLFTSLEFISIAVLFFLYLRQIINLWNYPNSSYDKIDLILIYSSAIQLIIFFLRLCISYNIFSVLVLIIKLSQNLMICSLLMIIILDKYSNSKTKIINYFLITLLIVDILLFLIGINDDTSFNKTETESMFHTTLAIICSIINLIIIFKSYKFKVETTNKINDNLNKNKLVSLQNLNNINNDSEGDNEEQNNEKTFFDTLLNQYLSNAINILAVYLNILIPFFVSYIIEIIIYFFFNSNNVIRNENNENNNSTITNNITYNDTSDNNRNYNNSININNTIDNTCIFIQNYGESFVGKFCVCLILFFFRDFLPYLIAYLMFFYFKLKYHRRSF